MVFVSIAPGFREGQNSGGAINQIQCSHTASASAPFNRFIIFFGFLSFHRRPLVWILLLVSRYVFSYHHNFIDVLDSFLYIYFKYNFKSSFKSFYFNRWIFFYLFLINCIIIINFKSFLTKIYLFKKIQLNMLKLLSLDISLKNIYIHSYALNYVKQHI